MALSLNKLWKLCHNISRLIAFKTCKRTCSEKSRGSQKYYQMFKSPDSANAYTSSKYTQIYFQRCTDKNDALATGVRPPYALCECRVVLINC